MGLECVARPGDRTNTLGSDATELEDEEDDEADERDLAELSERTLAHLTSRGS